MKLTNYSLEIERDVEYLPWPWVTFILADGERMYNTCQMSFTRSGAIRKAKRQVKDIKAQYAPKATKVTQVEVIAL